MTSPIYIIGAGGFGREVLWLIREINSQREQFSVEGFVDDNEELHGETVCDVPVIGSIETLREMEGVSAAMSIGIPRVKRKIIEHVRDWGLEFPSLVAPSVQMSDYVDVGNGAIITAGNILTTQVSVGDFAIINLACTIGHDAVIGEGATLSPGVNVSGYVEIGDYVDVGTNSSIIPGISVGAASVIGAGAVIIRDVPAKSTVVGNPGKVIKQAE